MADLDYIFKAIRLLPDFDGNVNVLTRFISLCDQLVEEFIVREPTNKLREVALINGILNKIIGPAARLINSNGIPTNWQGIRGALINNFSDQRDETALYKDLALLTQGQGTPQEFYERCQNLFSTLMTYISLHENISTTLEAKRELYKKLTLQAYVRGLKDPLGSRIRCMRPDTIEKALEYVHEEESTLYLQQRNEHLADRKPSSSMPFKMPTQNMYVPPPRHQGFSMPGPSKPPYSQASPQQWRHNFHQNQVGPTRTMQIFRAAPPNYNPNNNAFRMPQRNPAPQPQQPRPMSGVSHFVPRNLPPTAFARAHDWSKLGNPPPSNYFKTREMNFNDCLGYENYYEDYYTDFHPNSEYDQYAEYYCTDSEPQFYQEPAIVTPIVEETTCAPTDQDFQNTLKSEKLK